MKNKKANKPYAGNKPAWYEYIYFQIKYKTNLNKHGTHEWKQSHKQNKSKPNKPKLNDRHEGTTYG